ncbi:unnamed protein product, partial [Prorocentrum cordatum]
DLAKMARKTLSDHKPKKREDERMSVTKFTETVGEGRLALATARRRFMICRKDCDKFPRETNNEKMLRECLMAGRCIHQCPGDKRLRPFGPGAHNRLKMPVRICTRKVLDGDFSMTFIGAGDDDIYPDDRHPPAEVLDMVKVARLADLSLNPFAPACQAATAAALPAQLGDPKERRHAMPISIQALGVEEKKK